MAITLGNGVVTPAPQKAALPTNYLDFTSSAVAGWAQQYLPELYEAEVEKYGDRSIGGFLRMVGAEMPMSSDQVVWSEQGRLHLSYTGTLGADIASPAADGGTNSISGLPSGHAVRVNQTVAISDGSITGKAIVTEVGATSIKVKGYKGALVAGASMTAGAVTLFVYGSEFKKGSAGMTEKIEPQFKSYTNKPIILKDFYEISGSDAAQIGWVEVSGEAGQSGYLWYVKAEADTRKRFEDYLEMSLVEAEKSATEILDGISGTEGLFAAIQDRGHYNAGVDSTGSGSAAANLADFDALLKALDKQGAIEENMLFVNRDLALTIDDMLAGIGNANYANGTSFGVFNNSEDMALNLGFSGFRRGSYDFYKTDWKYLNDASTRGAADFGVRGVLIPAGTSSVYDQVLGRNIKRPFLHVRYRASEADDRRMKSWITGSVGGATTSGDDVMQVHYLSERCLVVQAANNFVLFN
jgi:hypothetical protein